MSGQFNHRTCQSSRTVFRRLKRSRVAPRPGKGYGALPPRRMSWDFNYPYNPYSVYNPISRCPIPPVENRFNAEIDTGEKSFHDTETHCGVATSGIRSTR